MLVSRIGRAASRTVRVTALTPVASQQLHSSAAQRRLTPTLPGILHLIGPILLHSPRRGIRIAATESTVLTDTPNESWSNLRRLLAQHAPCIHVATDDIRVLSSPDEFYQTLLQLSASAQRRVLLSSLYLGTGPHEQRLVETLRQSMVDRPELRVTVLLDYLRGTRAVGKEHRDSSVTVLQPLSTIAADSNATSSARFTLSLLHVPPPTPPVITPFRAWIERQFFTGHKSREAVGVHHMKFYVFDDTVIVSGANLSDTYFTNRQDRYILIRSAELASFYASLTHQIQQLPFCQTIHAGKSLSPATHASTDSDAARKGLLPLLRPSATVDDASTDASTTLVFPTLQLGSLGIQHDEELTVRIFELLHARTMHAARLDVATGYMNLTERYLTALLPSQHPVEVIAAARDANGWYGATGGGRYVPELYAAAAYEFLRRAYGPPTARHVHLREWSHPGWSYHAKGFWLTLPNTGSARTPVLTSIGSPNYGARSVERDTETSLLLLTRPDSSFAQQLAKERDELQKHAQPVALQADALNQAAVAPPLWLRWLSKLARPYM